LKKNKLSPFLSCFFKFTWNFNAINNPISIRIKKIFSYKQNFYQETQDSFYKESVYPELALKH